MKHDLCQIQPKMRFQIFYFGRQKRLSHFKVCSIFDCQTHPLNTNDIAQICIKNLKDKLI